jgi:hypothetical protein
MTPHNFTLPDAEFGLVTDVDIAAGETVEVHLNPLWPGNFIFYCKSGTFYLRCESLLVAGVYPVGTKF